MAIVSVTPIAATNAVHRFGEGPTDSRQFVVEVDDPSTPTPQIAAAPGVGRLDVHPEYAYMRAFDVSVSVYGNSRWHYLVSWDYRVPAQQGVVENPLARPDIWRWTTGAINMPTLWYYDDSDNQAALTNSAGDYIENITRDVPTLTAHISGNRPTFDYGLATSVHGAINDGVYLGGAQYTWRVDGIAGEPAVEIVGGQEMRFWRVEVALTYNPTGWPLQVPNVGFNYLESGSKKRCWVNYTDDTGYTTKVPTSLPVPLDDFGAMKSAGSAPDIKTKRLQKRINFQSYFGVPT